MTPMIDVVFQLIIFFVVTINMSDNRNLDIRLEKGINSPEIKNDEQSSPLTMVVEVDKKGKISINNVRLTEQQLTGIVNHRHHKYGTFPVMVRADYRTKHRDVKKVMDICSREGIGRVAFVAIKDARTPEGREAFSRK